MAADILMYDANYVPVGKDQQQHLEMTRDIAVAFNNRYGETFVVPEVLIDEQVMTIPGTDGQKMSKTYRNTIDIFLPEKELRKQVMSIVTDSTPLDAPKNPDTCTVFALYRLLAGADQIGDLRRKYGSGGFGYGHAKQTLFELILEKFRVERTAFDYFMRHPEEINRLLEAGEMRARDIGITVLNRVREKLGFGAQTSGIHL
jgi:tryptophanyl-tRNA synthetase